MWPILRQSRSLIDLPAGGVFLIPANGLHAIRIPPEGLARLLDVYSPPRAEYR